MRNPLTFFILALLAISLISCKHAGKEHTHEESETAEHSTVHEKDHEEGADDEEQMLGITETFDAVKNGLRLLLAYNPESEQFEGNLINTTDEIIENARVEVQLSNGMEIGPTESLNLEAGQRVPIHLDAIGQIFEQWNTHTEIGIDEHNHDGEGEHSH